MDSRTLVRTVAAELDVRPAQVSRTIDLLDGGNTIPFIARYRKEVTGSLDEEQLRTIAARAEYLRKLEDRKQTVLKSIQAQGKLTEELARKIEAASVLQELEDLYLPYKPKRRTRAIIAREHGLEPLADMMTVQNITEGTPELYAANYLNDTVPTVEEALAGARDIVAETIAENADARAFVRRRLLSEAILTSRLSKKADDREAKYRDYYEYAERLSSLPPHRILAINRGERDKVLKVTIKADDESLIVWLLRRHVHRRECIFVGQLRQAIEDGYERLLRPSIEREVRALCTKEAESHAIRVFGANLRSLLLQPPLRNVRILGIDPGYRTGCKVAEIDETGMYMASCTIYPHPPQKHWQAAKQRLQDMIANASIQVIAIGNGTASRETEALVAEIIAERTEQEATQGTQVAYVIVNEAGASVYSAARLAAKELPQLDVSMRGAASIARRLLDPLAELVKIEPQHVGVGLYQHDVNQRELGQALDAVVESAVNHVGVDVNTASPALLQHIAGLNARVATAIVDHRDAQGIFRRRRDLLSVKSLGAKTFQQAAGFLKIPNGDNSLDNTFIHPESYEVCHNFLRSMGLCGDEDDLPQQVQHSLSEMLAEGHTLKSLAKKLGTGAPTLEDMISSLVKPGRDPRDELPAPILRQDVLRIEDLAEGMVLKGTVRNVVDFGAFVDIGVKQDGLVHISEMANRYVRDPLEVVAVGDVVDVRVINIDIERGRIGLSMKK